jgi:hypothetical protein
MKAVIYWGHDTNRGDYLRNLALISGIDTFLYVQTLEDLRAALSDKHQVILIIDTQVDNLKDFSRIDDVILLADAESRTVLEQTHLLTPTVLFKPLSQKRLLEVFREDVIQ